MLWTDWKAPRESHCWMRGRKKIEWTRWMAVYFWRHSESYRHAEKEGRKEGEKEEQCAHFFLSNISECQACGTGLLDNMLQWNSTADQDGFWQSVSLRHLCVEYCWLILKISLPANLYLRSEQCQSKITLGYFESPTFPKEDVSYVGLDTTP